MSQSLGGAGQPVGVSEADLTGVSPSGPVASAPLPTESAGLSRTRRIVAAVVLVIGLPVLSEVLVQQRDRLSYATPVLLMLSLVVVVCLVGGIWVAVPAAVLGGLVLNWFFTPPYGTLTITAPNQIVVLVVYLGIAVAIAVIVDLAARRTAEAARARAEAQTLSGLAGATLAESQTLPDLLERIRATFGMRVVSLVVPTAGAVADTGDGTVDRSDDGGGAEQVVARTDWSTVPGSPAFADPGAGVEESTIRVPAGPVAELVASGPTLIGADRRVIASFARAVGTAYEGRQLAEQARRSAELAAADRMRTALLASVGHDLRTPLAAIKASSSGLLQADVALSAEDNEELLRTIDAAADRLQSLIANLLDASRLQAGAVNVRSEPVSVADAVAAVIADLPASTRDRVRTGPGGPDDPGDPAGLTMVVADPGLLDRVLANLVDNALRHAPDSEVVVGITRNGAEVSIDVVDHGPGVPEAERDAIFTPFQRLGDRDAGGVGLGLSVAQGFAAAMDGRLEARQSDGGGLTMRLTLPSAGPAGTAGSSAGSAPGAVGAAVPG